MLGTLQLDFEVLDLEVLDLFLTFLDDDDPRGATYVEMFLTAQSNLHTVSLLQTTNSECR